jgi:integrase
MRRVGPTEADKRLAGKIAEQINAALALGQYAPEKSEEQPVPFDRFAKDWVHREVMLPIERGIEGHLARGSARSYELQVRVHLIPFFRNRDVREIKVADIQAFYNHCIDTGRPRSRQSIELVLTRLRQILGEAKAQGILELNPVEGWKRDKAGKGRRRSTKAREVSRDEVFAADELAHLLTLAEREASAYFPLILFLADTGARFGEATALRWIDVDLNVRTARIARSFSSGMYLGPTKTGKVRTVELSTRLVETLSEMPSALFPEKALVFPSKTGGFINPRSFRKHVWRRLVRKALSRDRELTPHSLRHTFVSLHMARGSNLKWIQEQGGWASAKMLLDCYGHFMPSESRGYADALSAAPDGTIRHQLDQTQRANARGGAKTRAPSRASGTPPLLPLPQDRDQTDHNRQKEDNRESGSQVHELEGILFHRVRSSFASERRVASELA